jgi:hypothetical protein
MAGPLGAHYSSCNMASCLDLFRLGWDTVRIAAYWQISEAEALRRVSVERSKARSLPIPYEVAP